MYFTTGVGRLRISLASSMVTPRRHSNPLHHNSNQTRPQPFTREPCFACACFPSPHEAATATPLPPAVHTRTAVATLPTLHARHSELVGVDRLVLLHLHISGTMHAK